MNRTKLLTGLLGVCVVFSSVYSQESSEKSKSSGNRLPRGYTKIGLRESQRESIYAIQKSYAEKIEPLMEQIKQLQAERDAAIEKVLTEDQRKELKAVMTAATAKSQAKKESTKKESPSTESAPK